MRRNNNEKHGKGEQRVRVGVKEEGKVGVGREVWVCVCAHARERGRLLTETPSTFRNSKDLLDQF